MMKVLLLNGSANTEGNTFTALHTNGQPIYPEREEWQGMNCIR